eukprot:gene26249-31708_t
MSSIGVKRRAPLSPGASTDKVVVAYQGAKGAFTFLATQQFFSTKAYNVELIANQTLKAVYDSLLKEKATYGFVPLESSSYGTIHGVYDQLVATDGKIEIVGEVGQIEHFCLCIAKDDAQELDITKVLSHPHIMECCSDYLDSLDARRQQAGRPPVERVAVNDSSTACGNVAAARNGDGVVAAIGSREGAEIHKLKILVSGVGNDKNAETRYIVLARRDATTNNLVDPLYVNVAGTLGRAEGPKRGRKTSIAIVLRNTPGAIFKMSSCFAFRSLDILKIESRPLNVAMQLSSVSAELRAFSQRHWNLIFYIDYEPSAEEEVNARLLASLEEYAVWMRVLGTYEAGLQAVETMPSDWSSMTELVSQCF